MAMKFAYTAMDGQGKEQHGRVEAENEQEASAKLKQQGLFPTGIKEIRSGGGGRGLQAGGATAAKKGGLLSMQLGTPTLNTKKLSTATRQLATLLNAGLPLVRALRTLERQAKKDISLRRITGDLANSVEGGSTFTEALQAHPKTFSKLYINMVRAGEASGALEGVLERLAVFMEKGQRIAGKVKSAMVYPVIVLVVAMTITSGLMVFVVPKFGKIFEEMLPGSKLPGLTRFVIGISNAMVAPFTNLNNCIIYAILLAVLAVAFSFVRKTKFWNYYRDLLAVKLPPINTLVIRTTVSRFCRTLGTLMQSGVSVLQALQIVRDTAGNEIVSRAVQTIHDAVKEGENMSKPMYEADIFPGMVVSMVEVGEETGALPEMLNRVADIYEEEVDRAVETLTSLIEPFMMVFLAIVIGTIVIALFLPLVELIKNIGSQSAG